jgi:hypothetical protein
LVVPSAVAAQLLAHQALSARLRQSWDSVVVLERIARGGGAVNWYFVVSPGQVAEVMSRLRPGSRVSFYFEGHLRREPTGEAACARMFEQILTVGELVLGYPERDLVEMRTDLVFGARELTDAILAARLDRSHGDRLVVWGPWPAPDDDGRSAITVNLVDEDGQLRRHPH